MPISSSSPSQPANKPLAPSQTAKPITQVFIQGKLSEESDSGKRGIILRILIHQYLLGLSLLIVRVI